MIELGWGTPSLVTVRMGLLIEASQFVILGQVIVQLPPAVSADLALLYLRLDFVGSVVFSPLRIAFDAKLVNSRVAFITITGQFAFRADFGDHPTFLISAGGFHPRFKEIPSDIPSPFDRIGASFDIGIIGISYKGYFAITSATIQAGSDLRVWADVGIASIEGGFGFDAICYLEPKFYFEIDLHAYLAVEVFDMDFAAIRLNGTMAGPGRWHIAGTANVETPWPLPDFSLSIDESWGTDRETPVIKVDIAAKLKQEIGKIENWSAQLPKGGESYLTLANCDAGANLLAHPLGSLVFQQKLIPLELRLAKASGSKIIGANEFSNASLILSQVGNPAVGKPATSRKDYFATAQFLEVSEDDRLAKPSFESYTAGYELDDDAYETAPLASIVTSQFSYEEANLGTVRKKRLVRSTQYRQEHQGLLIVFGAAGRSSLRDKQLHQPVLSAAIKVNPAPVMVVDKSTLQAVAATRYTSYWQAEQSHLYNSSINSAKTQVAELQELTL
jgi:hypothetical protein